MRPTGRPGPGSAPQPATPRLWASAQPAPRALAHWQAPRPEEAAASPLHWPVEPLATQARRWPLVPAVAARAGVPWAPVLARARGARAPAVRRRPWVQGQAPAARDQAAAADRPMARRCRAPACPGAAPPGPARRVAAAPAWAPAPGRVVALGAAGSAPAAAGSAHRAAVALARGQARWPAPPPVGGPAKARARAQPPVQARLQRRGPGPPPAAAPRQGLQRPGWRPAAGRLPRPVARRAPQRVQHRSPHRAPPAAARPPCALRRHCGGHRPGPAVHARRRPSGVHVRCPAGPNRHPTPRWHRRGQQGRCRPDGCSAPPKRPALAPRCRPRCCRTPAPPAHAAAPPG